MPNSTVIGFTKMHGLGNDFMIVDLTKRAVPMPYFNVTALSNRQCGIGFDQLILIKSSVSADFSCQFFNADGSEAEQCGNGLRCVARFLLENELTKKTTLKIATKAGNIGIEIHSFDAIEVDMGLPQKISELKDLIFISMGNPHAIVKVDAIDNVAVMAEGKEIASQFSTGANVGFMQIIDPTTIRLRTYERGVGETFACGSNACASVVAGIQRGWLEKKVRVELPFGELFIEWEGPNHPIKMTGPASMIYSGNLLVS